MDEGAAARSFCMALSHMLWEQQGWAVRSLRASPKAHPQGKHLRGYTDACLVFRAQCPWCNRYHVLVATTRRKAAARFCADCNACASPRLFLLALPCAYVSKGVMGETIQRKGTMLPWASDSLSIGIVGENFQQLYQPGGTCSSENLHACAAGRSSRKSQREHPFSTHAPSCRQRTFVILSVLGHSCMMGCMPCQTGTTRQSSSKCGRRSSRRASLGAACGCARLHSEGAVDKWALREGLL